MRYGLPPNAGGQRDQPARWFDRGELLDRVYRAFVAYKQREPGHDAAWQNGHAAEWKLVRAVQEIMNNG